jgi:hypothetical protein
MEVTNTTVPTRLKKYNPNWYTVAAVATALQLSVDNDIEAKALPKARCIDFRDLSKVGSVPSTSTVLIFDNKNLEAASVNTVLSANDTEDQEEFTDVAIKPRYVKEFKIKVATIKIQKALPKIFVD